MPVISLNNMNPQTIFESLMNDFLDAGIPLNPKVIDPILHYSSAVTRLGSCQKMNGIYHISLSRNAMKDEEQVRNTLAHELVHTLPRCMNHGKTFHKYGTMVEERLGIPIDSRATKSQAQAAGIQDAYRNRANYKIVCEKCGFEFYRLKRSAVIDHPSRYRCSRCGGGLKVYQIIRSK